MNKYQINMTLSVSAADFAAALAAVGTIPATVTNIDIQLIPVTT